MPGMKAGIPPSAPKARLMPAWANGPGIASRIKSAEGLKARSLSMGRADSPFTGGMEP